MRLSLLFSILRVLLLLPLFLTANGEDTPEPIRVVGSSPPDGTIVKEGYDVRLSCKTSIKWFFCLWRSPDGNKQCAIQESSPRSVCSPDERVVLEGGPRTCELLLRNASAPDDYGSWMCTVNDAETFESVKHYINLEIAVPAVVEFDPRFGQDRVLTITENEEQSINCKAFNAHPTPIISWEAHESLRLDTTAEPLIRHDESSHSSEVNHASIYKAKLEDNNRIITCVATQLDHDGRTVLYENSASIKLNVEKIILPVDYALHQRIGIISGVLLSIIFLLLLILCLFIFLCRRRRRQRHESHMSGDGKALQQRSRASSSQISIHTSPDLSLPSVKPIWTVKQGDRYKGRDDTHMLAKKYEIKISPTNITRPHSQVTVSTLGSREGSWAEMDEEENRSIGSAIIHCQPLAGTANNSPRGSLTKLDPPRETHFDETMEEDEFSFDLLPRPVINQQPSSRPMGLPPLGPPSHTPPSYLTSWRPNSAALQSEPYYHFGYGSQAALTYTRPSSSLSYPNSVADPTKPIELFYYNFPTPKRLPSPNGLTNTSGVSVFECDLGCFKIPPDGSPLKEEDGSKEEDIDFNDIITRNQPKETSEEDPRDV